MWYDVITKRKEINKMKFINANTARAMAKEYEDNAKNRFLNELNEEIITAAKCGAHQLRKRFTIPEDRRKNLCLYLASLGYVVEPVDRPGTPINTYKIKW